MTIPHTCTIRTIEPRDTKPGWWFLSMNYGPNHRYAQFEFPDSEMDTILAAKVVEPPKPKRAGTWVYGDPKSAVSASVATMLVGDQGLFDLVLKTFPHAADYAWMAPAHLTNIRKLVGEGIPARLHFNSYGELVGVFHSKAGYTMRPAKEAK